VSQDPPDARRLIQIASRRLAALGIACERSQDGGLLTGVLPDEGAPIVNPLSGKRLQAIRIYVEGHDRLRMIDPPALAGLPPLEFFSHPDCASLRAAIASLVSERGQVIAELRNRLHKLGFELDQDDGLAHVRARLDLELLGTVAVEVDEEGLRLVQATPLMGGEPVHLGGMCLDLEPLKDASDVEISLSTLVEKALRQKKPARAPSAPAPPRHRPRVLAQAAARDRASLGWLLDALGPEFFASQSLALSRSLTVDGLPGRFEIHFRDRTLRNARIYVREQLRWHGELTLGQLATLESFAARALQGARAPGIQASELGTTEDTHGMIPPVPSEIWVMDVQVEHEGPEEVRYVGLNAQGGRQGAPRVLPRHTFEKVFLPHGMRHRFFVKVTAVTDTHVAYQRLNVDRQPVAAARQLKIEVFLATFVAHAVAD
jgi:hypothetical protein